MNKAIRLLMAILLALPLQSTAAVKPVNAAHKKTVKRIERTTRRTTRADATRQGVMATLKYEKLPDMARGRTDHLMIPTDNGGFVVVGGTTTDRNLVTVAELWQNGSWKTLPLSAPHADGFAAKLSDGRFMVGGCKTGQQALSVAKNTDIFNPATQSFSAGPDMTIGRAGCKAIVAGGKVFVSGNSGGGRDNAMDCYDGSSFKGVGDMDGRYHPYLFHLPDGHIISMSYFDNNEEPIELYTFNDGSKALLADFYDMSTGEVQYTATPYDDTLIPAPLPADISSSDYHFTQGGMNFYMILAGMIDETLEDGYRYVLLFYCAEEDETYMFSSLQIPMRHPETGASIDYRGGVIVNQARQEAYIIGHSGYYEDETLHILSFNYVTEEWTLASAPGFNHDLTETAAWTLLSDGRLACTGGVVPLGSPSADAYIFTPPVAGMGDTEPDPGTMVDRNFLVIETKDHVQTTYMLAEKPEVRFEGTNLRVVSAKADVTYQLTDILRFTYEKRSVTGVSELQSAPATVDYEDGELVISGIKAGAAVGVYSLDGKLVRQLTAQHAGTYRLSLSALPRGVYVVKADNVTYKIMKR